MERVVLSIGGSIINPGEPDIEYLKLMGKSLVKLSKNYSIAIVTGGGKIARIYAKAVIELGGNEFLGDEVAIFSTYQNACLLIAAFGEHAYPSPLTDFNSASEALLSGKIVVMGGTIPGITTDSDAALLAEKICAKRLVNISRVDGIYSSDPNKYSNAKKFSSLSFKQLIQLASRFDTRKAGENFVFDILACKIIARSKIETHFVGKEINEIERAIQGKKHGGTLIK